MVIEYPRYIEEHVIKSKLCNNSTWPKAFNGNLQGTVVKNGWDIILTTRGHSYDHFSPYHDARGSVRSICYGCSNLKVGHRDSDSDGIIIPSLSHC